MKTRICKDGHEYVIGKGCEICRKAYYANWSAKNEEHLRVYRQKYYQNNKVEKLAYSRKWREEHREYYEAQNARYYAENRERQLEANHLWRQANAERHRENARRWSAQNRDRRAAHEHKRRARKLASPGTFTVAEWGAIKAKQKQKCVRCGAKRRLTIDHIIPLSKGGCNMAINIQGLCLSCNTSKREFLQPGTTPSLFDLGFSQ